MKRVILNENQVETLLEYAGYVNVFERLTDIVVERFYERLIDPQAYFLFASGGPISLTQEKWGKECV